MHPEKYSLTWHTYSDHLKSMMRELMMNEDFSDITLVTEDKKHIKANINILSACSPVFKDILRKEKNSNQIMYLRGVQFSEMESIMQFIYLGEATFYEERMDEFLSVSKSLEIRELCNAETKSNDEPDDETSQNEHEIPTELVEEHTVISDQMNIHAPKERQKSVVNDNGRHECDQCHKTYSGPGGLYNHKQSAHQGVKYACYHCNYQATSQGSLTIHIQSRHEGIKYACDQCDYQATSRGNLTIHIQSRHEGIKYACDQCDYQATTQSHLTRHIQSKHEGIKYACDQCDHQATTQSHLTRHIQSKHEGIKYVCDQCDHQATRQEYLTKHIRSKHEQ